MKISKVYPNHVGFCRFRLHLKLMDDYSSPLFQFIIYVGKTDKYN